MEEQEFSTFFHMEQEYNNLGNLGLNLGVSWSVFGNARESDLDDLLLTKNIHGEARMTVVDLWKRHPNRQQGEFNSISSHDSIQPFP